MVDSTHPTHFRILGVNWMRSRTLLFRCAVGSVVFHLVLMMLHAVPKGQNVWDSITIENLLAPEVFSVHHTKQIRLQNQYVGTVSMLCHPNKAGDVQHPDLPSCQFDHSWLSCNITGPKVIHSRPWMHHTLSSHKLILFYGTHSEGQESIQAFASQEAHGPFEHLNLSLPFTKYTSVRSLSIFVDDDKQRLYM